LKKTTNLFILLVLAIFSLTAVMGCASKQETQKASQAPVEPVNITVAAAASLKDAGNELKDLFVKTHPQIKVTYNFASSGTLQKQIEEGAPADLFISAGKSQMDALAAKGLIVDSSRQDLLGNTLVLVAKKDSTLSSFDGLADANIKKISIGTPETVPAGKYAQETLTTLKLWDKIQTKLVLAKDVRQVLTYVETGNVDAGLVYNSDFISSKDLKVVALAPADSHKAIVYPMALIKNSQHQKEAQEFAGFLSSQEAAAVFTKYGFEVGKK